MRSCECDALCFGHHTVGRVEEGVEPLLAHPIEPIVDSRCHQRAAGNDGKLHFLDRVREFDRCRIDDSVPDAHPGQHEQDGYAPRGNVGDDLSLARLESGGPAVHALPRDVDELAGVTRSVPRDASSRIAEGRFVPKLEPGTVIDTQRASVVHEQLGGACDGFSDAYLGDGCVEDRIQ